MTRFNDLLCSREHRFAIGRDLHTGRAYVSIPVSNRMVDYEEFYAIDDARRPHPIATRA